MSQTGKSRNQIIGRWMWIVVCATSAMPDVRGQCSLDWKPGDPAPGVVDSDGMYGSAHLATVWNPDGPGPAQELLVVTGQFTLAGKTPVQNIAAWDGTTWQTLGDGITDGYISALSTYNDTLVAAGYFNGLPINTVAAVWNGNSWIPLGDGIAGMSDVYSNINVLITDGNDLFAGGVFSTSGGVVVGNVARWDGTTWTILGGALGTNDNGVRALAMYNGKLIAGGRIYNSEQPPIDNIAQWNGSSWEDFGGGIDGDILGFTLYDDELIVTGGFNSAGGIPVKNIGAWDGSQWQPLGGGLIKATYSPVSFNGLLTVSVYGSYGNEDIEQWDGSNWVSLRGGTNANYGTRLVQYREELIGVGDFNEPGISNEGAIAFNVARWDGTYWRSLGASSKAYSFGSYKGNFYSAGTFWSAGNEPPYHIARWAGDRWEDSKWLSFDYFSNIQVFLEFGNDLIVSGRFYIAGDPPLQNIARWNGTQWTNMGDGFNHDVNALVIYNGEIVAGGDFDHSGTTPLVGIARWDGKNWVPLADGASLQYGQVGSLEVYHGNLYATGYFPNGDGTYRIMLEWDGQSWTDLGASLNNSQSPYIAAGPMTISHDKLIVGGYFDTVNGQPASNVAQWDGKSWHPMGNNAPIQPFGFARYNGTLIAGGQSGIAQWDGIEWHRLELDGDVWNLGIHGRELFAAGSFIHAGSEVSALWARFGPTGLLGDSNSDGHVALADFASYAGCRSAPLPADAIAASSSDCLCLFNSDGDADVDLRDFAAIQVEFGK